MRVHIPNCEASSVPQRQTLTLHFPSWVALSPIVRGSPFGKSEDGRGLEGVECGGFTSNAVTALSIPNKTAPLSLRRRSAGVLSPSVLSDAGKTVSA